MSLRGKTIAITRPREQAHELAELITRLGGKPRIASTVEIRPVMESKPIRQFVNKVVGGRIDLVIFMSRNAVTHLLEASNNMKLGKQLVEALNRTKIVAVGPKTRKELEDHGIKVDVIPADYSSEGIVGVLAKLDLRTKIVAIPRTNMPSDYLKRELEKTCQEVLEIPVYESSLPSDRSSVVKLLNDMFEGEIDVITFTSSSTAQNLFKVAEEHGLQDALRKCLKESVVVVSIGPATRKALEELGVEVHVMPSSYTLEDMVAALENRLSNSENHTISTPTNLNETDKKLIQLLQDDFPLMERPWKEVGDKLNISEDEVITRLKRLCEEGVIHKIGPVIDGSKIGLTASTLVAMKVPKKKIDDVALVINKYDNVSHNYEREHEYNIWFTITASNTKELATILKEIERKTSIKQRDVLNLPTIRRFKIDVRFQLR